MKNLYLLAITLLFFSCNNESTSSQDESSMKRPNIVWLVCEDQSPYFFPFYGDSTVRLPNLEQLANEGVVYENMYAPVPVCSPARSAIITGMYPATLGTHNMRVFNPYKPENEAGINVPSYSPVFPEGVRPFTEYLRAAGYYCTNNSKEDYNFKPNENMWNESNKKATWKNRGKDQPFFSVYNFNVTHESAIWRLGKKPLKVAPDKVKRLPYFPDDPIVNHDLAVNYSNLVRMDSMVGALLQELRDSNLLEQTIIFFYGDHGGPFPRHKRSLYESGTKVPFVVRFPNKENQGTRNKDMLTFLDFAPTVLSLAEVKPSEVIQGKAFLGKYKDPEKRKYVFTTSDRFDEVYDRRRAVKGERYKYIRNFNPDLPYAIPVSYRLNMPMMNRLIEMDKNNELKGAEKLWMAKQMPKEELYDLKTDPFELNNLVREKEYEDTLLQFRQRLDDWMLEVNDLGGTDEQELIKRWSTK